LPEVDASLLSFYWLTRDNRVILKLIAVVTLLDLFGLVGMEVGESGLVGATTAP
jgi:hypothetical protein